MRLFGKCRRRNQPQSDGKVDLTFVLPGNHEVTLHVATVQEALLEIRRDYGVKAHREAWLKE